MRFLLSTLLFSWVISVNAQTISGVIVDVNQNPLANATVSLIKAKDSSLVTMNAADPSGGFGFSPKDTGLYRVRVTNIGYQTVYSSVLHYLAATQKLDPIVLEKNSSTLGAVMVTAKRPLIEARAGKMVVNVDALPTNTGLNVLEVLEKSPGITVDNDGNVSLKGKSGVLILIDGKPTYMSGASLATYLKSMQSSSLDQIEIMTSPPAKYDAAGNAGVINIKTKKGVVRGMNGSLTTGFNQGFYANYFGDVNMNYRSQKFNVFASYNGGKWENRNRQQIDRVFYAPDNITRTGSADQVSFRHSQGKYQNAKIGIDYFLTKKDVVGIVLNGNTENWNQHQPIHSNIRNADGKIDYILQSLSTNSGNARNLTTNLNYKHSFDSTGREWTVDLDQAYYKNDGISNLSTQALNPTGEINGLPVDLQGKMPSVISIYSAKTDYIHPFAKEWKLETGVKTSMADIDNAVTYLRNSDGNWMTDASRTNQFLYKEAIYAAYGTLSKKLKNWEFTGGLRVEHTLSKGRQQSNDSAFTRRYTNLFPTLGMSWTLNEQHQFSASYNRRITRPDYDALNPFVYFLDSLTYSKGNPYLRPQFTNNMEFTHNFKKILTTTINYTQINDIITSILKTETEKKLSYETKENFSRMRQLGLSLNSNIPITKWWNLNAYVNVAQNHYEGLYNNGKTNQDISINYVGFNGNMTNSFTLLKTWNLELSGWYVGKDGDGGFLIFRNMGALNAAVAKSFLNKKASLKIGVRDIFKTQIFQAQSRYSDVDITVRNERDSRRFNISFTYKFGKNNMAASRNRKSGASEEQSRVRSGGGN